MQRVVTGSIMGTIIAAIGVGNSMWCVSGAPRANATFAQRIDERIAVRQRVEVSYQMAFDPARQELNVRIDVSGLDPQRDVMAFELPDWGEWTEVDSLYLRLLRGDPPVERDPENPRFFRLKAPEGWNGTPTLTYSIPLVDSNSQLRRRHGLLPWTKTDESGVWTASSYALAFANNTLMSVRVDGQPVETPREVRLSAPESMGIVTGWQGFSEGEQVVVLDHDIDKTPLLFGAPLAHAEATHAGVTYEIYQYSRGDDLTEAILELVQKLVPAYGKHTGRELGKPLRVFVTDTGGGQKTDHGLLLQPWHEADLAPMYKQLIAHELFHEWLGGYVAAGDESLTWFQEGFTDYLALWHLARAGQIGHDWFAQRLSDINDAARTSSAYGQVSFADPTVSWRDWDGPNETLAYRGGTVLALGLDVELRKHGKPGLSELIGALIRQGSGRYTIDALRSWVEEQGLREFWNAFVEQPALPDFNAVMADAGFARTRRIETDLAYAGLRISGEVFGTIEAIDPDGPAAKSGLRVGDRITGYWPVRGDRPAIDPSCDMTYPFGLNTLALDAGEINVGFIRGEEEMQTRVQPRRLQGGFWMAFEIDASDAERFFQ